MPDSPDVQRKDKKILAEAKKRFELCQDAEKKGRELALEDLKFRAGEQWPQAIKDQRAAEGKPCLTINVLPARERQILNPQRQNRSAIKVSPVDDKADPETAEVIQGIIRHIEYDSNADVAYDTAFASAVRIGFGYIQLMTEYESPDSFDQVIKIQRVRNPFTVYIDPTCQEVDCSDAEFAFVVDTLTKEEFKREYPDSDLASMDDWRSVGDATPEWLSESGVRICQYIYKDTEKDTLLRIRNAAGEERTVYKSALPDDDLPEGVTVVNERATEVTTVRMCKHSAIEVLEKADWPGKWIPIVKVQGDELDVDGKVVQEGMIRHAKDAVRMSNYMASAQVEAIGLAPKAPWVVAAGQIEDYPEWKTSNTANHSALRYKPISVEGTMVPAPHREIAEPAVAAIAQARMLFNDDLKAVQGIYDAQLGQRSNESSGRAIDSRKVQGEVANFHFIDNLGRARKFLGLQIVDVFQKVYTGPRVLRMIGEDDTQETVKINQKFMQGGIEKIFDTTVGKYDVTISSGPSFETRRQEAAETMLELRKANPNAPPIYDDLIFQNMDFPGHEEMAARAKKALPPGLADDDQSDPKVVAQQAQAKLQAVLQQHQQLTQALGQANDIIKTKQIEAQGRTDIAHLQEVSKQAIVKMQEATKLAVAQINASKDANQAFAERELEQYKILHNSAHDVALTAMQQAHAADQAEVAHGQTLEQQQQAADLAPQPVNGGAK